MFQLLEFLLQKMAASRYEMIASVLPKPICFHVPKTFFEKKTFGQMVQIYRNLTRNTASIKRLEGLVEHRNKLAHSALRMYISKDEKKQSFTLENLEEITAGISTSIAMLMIEDRDCQEALRRK